MKLTIGEVSLCADFGFARTTVCGQTSLSFVRFPPPGSQQLNSGLNQIRAKKIPTKQNNNKLSVAILSTKS